MKLLQNDFMNKYLIRTYGHVTPLMHMYDNNYYPAIQISKYNLPIFINYTVFDKNNKFYWVTSNGNNIKISDHDGNVWDNTTPLYFKEDKSFINNISNADPIDLYGFKIIGKKYDKIKTLYKDAIDKVLMNNSNNTCIDLCTKILQQYPVKDEENILIDCINGFDRFKDLQLISVYVAGYIYRAFRKVCNKDSIKSVLGALVDWVLDDIRSLTGKDIHCKLMSHKLIEYILQYVDVNERYISTHPFIECSKYLENIDDPIVDEISAVIYYLSTMDDYTKICHPMCTIESNIIRMCTKEINCKIELNTNNIPPNGSSYPVYTSATYTNDKIQLLIGFIEKGDDKVRFWCGYIDSICLFTGTVNLRIMVDDIFDQMREIKKSLSQRYKFREYSDSGNRSMEYYVNKYIDSICNVGRHILDDVYDVDKNELHEFTNITEDEFTNQRIFNDIFTRIKYPDKEEE